MPLSARVGKLFKTSSGGSSRSPSGDLESGKNSMELSDAREFPTTPPPARIRAASSPFNHKARLPHTPRSIPLPSPEERADLIRNYSFPEGAAEIPERDIGVKFPSLSHGHGIEPRAFIDPDWKPKRPERPERYPAASNGKRKGRKQPPLTGDDIHPMIPITEIIKLRQPCVLTPIHPDELERMHLECAERMAKQAPHYQTPVKKVYPPMEPLSKIGQLQPPKSIAQPEREQDAAAEDVFLETRQPKKAVQQVKALPEHEKTSAYKDVSLEEEEQLSNPWSDEHQGSCQQDPHIRRHVRGPLRVMNVINEELEDPRTFEGAVRREPSSRASEQCAAFSWAEDEDETLDITCFPQPPGTPSKAFKEHSKPGETAQRSHVAAEDEQRKRHRRSQEHLEEFGEHTLRTMHPVYKEKKALSPEEIVKMWDESSQHKERDQKVNTNHRDVYGKGKKSVPGVVPPWRDSMQGMCGDLTFDKLSPPQDRRRGHNRGRYHDPRTLVPQEHSGAASSGPQEKSLRSVIIEQQIRQPGESNWSPYTHSSSSNAVEATPERHVDDQDQSQGDGLPFTMDRLQVPYDCPRPEREFRSVRDRSPTPPGLFGRQKPCREKRRQKDISRGTLEAPSASTSGQATNRGPDESTQAFRPRDRSVSPIWYPEGDEKVLRLTQYLPEGLTSSSLADMSDSVSGSGETEALGATRHGNPSDDAYPSRGHELHARYTHTPRYTAERLPARDAIAHDAIARAAIAQSRGRFVWNNSNVLNSVNSSLGIAAPHLTDPITNRKYINPAPLNFPHMYPFAMSSRVFPQSRSSSDFQTSSDEPPSLSGDVTSSDSKEQTSTNSGQSARHLRPVKISHESSEEWLSTNEEGPSEALTPSPNEQSLDKSVIPRVKENIAGTPEGTGAKNVSSSLADASSLIPDFPSSPLTGPGLVAYEAAIKSFSDTYLGTTPMTDAKYRRKGKVGRKADSKGKGVDKSPRDQTARTKPRPQNPKQPWQSLSPSKLREVQTHSEQQNSSVPGEERIVRTEIPRPMHPKHDFPQQQKRVSQETTGPFNTYQGEIIRAESPHLYTHYWAGTPASRRRERNLSVGLAVLCCVLVFLAPVYGHGYMDRVMFYLSNGEFKHFRSEDKRRVNWLFGHTVLAVGVVTVGLLGVYLVPMLLFYLTNAWTNANV